MSNLLESWNKFLLSKLKVITFWISWKYLFHLSLPLHLSLLFEHMHVEVWGQLVGVSSLFPHCGSQGWYSGHEVWWQHLKSLSHLDGPLNIFQWVLLVDSFCVVEKQVITGLDYLCSKMALAKIYGWAFQLLTGDSPMQYYELILWVNCTAEPLKDKSIQSIPLFL